MATALVKYAGMKYGKKQVVNAFSSEDLYFETILTESRSGKTKSKKVKKRMPPGLTPEEEALLKKTKKSAWRLDMGLFNFMGIRFGWGAVVGIIPGFGDVIDFLFAYQLYRTICTLDPPLKDSKKHIMKLNLIVDAVIGLIPILGDLADGIYKCNTRNVAILEAELTKRGAVRIGAQPPSEQMQMSEVQEVRGHGGAPPAYESTDRHVKPEAAHTAPISGGLRGWFGGRKERDIESGDNFDDRQLQHGSRRENPRPRRDDY